MRGVRGVLVPSPRPKHAQGQEEQEEEGEEDGFVTADEDPDPGAGAAVKGRDFAHGASPIAKTNNKDKDKGAERRDVDRPIEFSSAGVSAQNGTGLKGLMGRLGI